MDKTYRLETEDLERLLELLQGEGYETIGPTLGNGTIVYDKITTAKDLPKGWTDEEEPASYRISNNGGERMFGYTLAPQSWKRFLYPPLRELFSIRRNGKSFETLRTDSEEKKFAFIGVRPCEVSAVLIQDKVFTAGEYRDDDYLSRRRNAFIVAVNCANAGANCFCLSMNTGPKASEGFDIALTEVVNDGGHYFVAEAGTDKGATLLERTGGIAASERERGEAEEVVERTASQITKSLDTRGLQEILAENQESPHWDDVAKRCLTCGNCTMVCPTCFCAVVEDSTDLSGKTASRTRRWDSCFTLDFARVSGGNFRITPKSRYRQWLTHKLSSWVEQFGIFGCVGCGRCITWCPVGIDITAEVSAIKGERVKQEKGA